MLIGERLDERLQRARASRAADRGDRAVTVFSRGGFQERDERLTTLIAADRPQGDDRAPPVSEALALQHPGEGLDAFRRPRLSERQRRRAAHLLVVVSWRGDQQGDAGLIFQLAERFGGRAPDGGVFIFDLRGELWQIGFLLRALTIEDRGSRIEDRGEEGPLEDDQRDRKQLRVLPTEWKMRLPPPQKMIGQPRSLLGIPERPHRRSQGKAACLPDTSAAIFILSGRRNATC